MRRDVIGVMVGLAWLPAVQAACPAPQLQNGLDLNLACLQFQGQKYSTTLTNAPVGALSWQWSGQIAPLACEDTEGVCAQLASDLTLSLPRFDLQGVSYRLNLAAAPDLGPVAWRYSGHEANASPSAQKLAELRSFMSGLVTDGTVPGAVLAVAMGANTVMLEAVGTRDAGAGTPTTTDTLFHIGSTNKALTSFLIARLVDEGVLQWDTRAQDIYPEFRLADAAAASQVTIRQLLDMTSGLPKDAETGATTGGAFLAALANVPMVSAPGSQYLYSNLSVSAAAYLAVLAQRKAANGSISQADLDTLHAGYEALLRSKVLAPLGMNDSYLYVDDARATGRMSKSHALQGSQFAVSESVDQRVDVIAPAGGLKSTAADMLAWMVAELKQGLAANGTRLVSAANMAERSRLSGVAGENEYGLCLEVKTLEGGIRHIGHSGSYDNFNSTIGYLPDHNIAYVLLTNGDSPAVLSLTGGGIEAQIAALVR